MSANAFVITCCNRSKTFIFCFDFKKMDFTDSRYLQSLSDKKSALSSFIDDFDKKVSEMKDSEEKAKLSAARKNLDNYILSMFSDEDE